ncbi:PDZ domain-containing protein [Anoxybacillus rupiensis]|uniref:PDZ domain-containing protein n=1 Tax=Anoxybacteroides rupiense TaxID=311460 RepID=A0ABT5W542_9BACL|nr:PDZ domain-containing protein [Anoxybacillus rupiensis]MBS2771238.1 PDZ domain-containing protein [Anoxybacillus rupiensis]MDE8564436.1 PDZ domain-containing protein [Anoxybacillus rupiensis]
MLGMWGMELLKGVGRLLTEPLLYYGVLLAAFVGWRRMNKERKHFHIRVYGWFQESVFFWRSGWAVGLFLSIVTVVSGMAVPHDVLLLLFYVTVLLSLTGQMRLLSPAYTVGGLVLLAAGFMKYGGAWPLVSKYVESLHEAPISVFIWLLALLLFAEGFLILRNGAVATSPQLAKSKRGLMIGEHWVDRIWFVPVLLPIPNGPLSSPFSWWPLFSGVDHSYSLALVPFLLGFSQHMQGMHPRASIQMAGRRVLWLAAAVCAGALASSWFPSLGIAVAAAALIARECLAFWQHRQDRSRPPYFSQQEQGLVILGILPESKAEKIGLKIGEVIAKVNGIPVKTEKEFYEALQHNRAFCKLEVLDQNAEVRFVQGALYENEHHELGLLFVQTREKWTSEAV